MLAKSTDKGYTGVSRDIVGTSRDKVGVSRNNERIQQKKNMASKEQVGTGNLPCPGFSLSGIICACESLMVHDAFFFICGREGKGGIEHIFTIS